MYILNISVLRSAADDKPQIFRQWCKSQRILFLCGTGHHRNDFLLSNTHLPFITPEASVTASQLHDNHAAFVGCHSRNTPTNLLWHFDADDNAVTGQSCPASRWSTVMLLVGQPLHCSSRLSRISAVKELCRATVVWGLQETLWLCLKIFVSSIWCSLPLSLV